MKTETETEAIDADAVTAFEESFRGRVVLPDDEEYDECRRVWNEMIDRYPAMIARCAGVADVIESVDFARENDLLLAVKAGGHNAAGNAVCDDGLVIDCSLMTSVRVDPGTKTVRVEPGVTMGDLDHETQAFGLATPGGTVSTTGVAGLTLGGGWGWLSRRFGLTIDNLRSVDVVTAAGELVHASEDENSDLFWGIRGGGGNFGIVTSFEFDCYEVGPIVLGGMVIHPFEDAADLLRFHREFTADMPDECCCYAAIMTAPPAPFLPEAVHGTKVAALAPFYSGPIETGEELFRPLRDFGEPIVDLVQPQPYTALQQMLDEPQAPGYRNYWKSQLVDPLPDDAIDTVVERAGTLPSPMSQLVLEHLGGAISRVEPDATAYRNRNAAFSFNVFSRWEDPAEDETHVSWAREFHAAMGPFATDGVAVNFLSQEGDERVRAAYGDNYDRLVDVKDAYDPENRFRMNQNITPSARADGGASHERV
ncbi:FAD-binding oxidoreductase [Natrinema sp. DC36]|uniref:FAD-binding oxidoreductase n=1 Tax=Natrinema sp. DC36 TaxID=2878680 RepID=UPI001CEFF070|nr:FAD-binding oxidoreductase [Natrinema sp. DC36]